MLASWSWMPRRSIGLAAMIVVGLGACSGEETPAPGVKSVEISLAQLQLAKGTTAAITVTAVLEDATRKDLAASAKIVSSAPSVIAVIAGPAVRAVAPGVATVTASYEGKSASAQVEVTPAALVELQLSPSTIDLAAGTSADLTATGVFTDDTHQDLTAQVEWSTSARAVATVFGGVVTAREPGTTTITAALEGVTATTAVNVTAALLDSLAVSSATLALPAGVTEAVVLTGTFSDGRMQNLTASAAWSSSNVAVVAIDAPGALHAVAPGQATVTVTSGALSATVAVTVTEAAPVLVELDPPVLFLPAGMAAQVTASARMTDGSVVDVTADATWTTSDAAIATVGLTGIDTGRVTAQAIGVTLITATFNGVSGRTDITVTAAELASLEISAGSSVELASGLTTRLTVKGIYTDATELELTDQVTWSSRNSQVATVSTARETAGLVQARSEGATEIVARMGGKQAVCAITVTPAVVTSLSISAGGGSVPVGLSLQAKATARMSDGTTPDVTADATWTSTSGAVLNVSAAGVVKGVSEGNASIRAAYGDKTAELAFTVTAPVMTKLVVTTPTSNMPMWRSMLPTARGTFSDGSSRDVTSEVTWTSSDENVAWVDWSGWIYSQNEGDVTITASATDGDAFGTVDLAVLPSWPSNLSIRMDGPALVVGAPVHFQVVADYEDGTSADVTYWASWWVDDGSVLDLLWDVPGEGTAVGEGTTWVYADLDGWTASMEITVAAAPEG